MLIMECIIWDNKDNLVHWKGTFTSNLIGKKKGEINLLLPKEINKSFTTKMYIIYSGRPGYGLHLKLSVEPKGGNFHASGEYNSHSFTIETDYLSKEKIMGRYYYSNSAFFNKMDSGNITLIPKLLTSKENNKCIIS